MKFRFFALSILILLITTQVQSSVLDDLAKPRDYESCRVSSYDPWGGNGDGGQWNPFKVGETRTIAEINSPGEISHLWFTLAPFDKDTLSNIILRIYWDGEKTPSVEAPIGAFFGLGHGKEYSFDSIPISVGNNRGLNCFFPMPFNRRAKITVENQSSEQLWAFYYYVDYKKFAAPQSDKLYFHAQYRQAKPELSKDNYVVLDTQGRGHYVGLFYYVRSNSGGWWGEGDDMIYIDGDKKPTLNGTGMEDYFCNAWGMKQGQAGLRFGAPLFELNMTSIGNENTAYRWHLEDAIAFKKSIKVTQEHGSENDRNDDFFSVAFWYQTHPHSEFPALPSKFERLSFADKKKTLLDEKKFAEYRALVSDFVSKAIDSEAKNNAVLDLGECFIAEGNKQKAVDYFNSYCGPIPVQGFTDQLKKKTDALGLSGIAVPQGDIWLVNSGDGRVDLNEIGGSKCYRTNTAAKSSFLYLKANNKDLRDKERSLLLEVEYYSAGSGKLLAEYNSAYDGDEVFTRYHHAEPIIMASEKGWHTAKIRLERAKLTGLQNSGADLRVSNPDGDLYIRKVGLAQL